MPYFNAYNACVIASPKQDLLSSFLYTMIMKQSFNEHLTLCYIQGIVNFINIALREKNKSGLKLDHKTSKSYKNGNYDSKYIELFVFTATGGIADFQVEGEQEIRFTQEKSYNLKISLNPSTMPHRKKKIGVKT